MKNCASQLIESAAENLGEDLQRLQRAGTFVADRIVRDTGRLAKRARYGLRNGAARLVDVEEKVVSQVKERPLVWILAGVGLATLIVLTVALTQKRGE